MCSPVAVHSHRILDYFGLGVQVYFTQYFLHLICTSFIYTSVPKILPFLPVLNRKSSTPVAQIPRLNRSAT